MKTILTITAVFLASIFAAAQSKIKPAYHLNPQIGLLNGDHFVSGQILLSGGIEKNGFSAGLGAGVDYYKIRTVPVFADLRAAFGKKSSVFSYLNVGTNIAWALESQYNTYWIMGGNSKSSFRNGVYTDMGIGYVFQKANKNPVTISIGYSMKTVGESHIEAVYRDFPPYIPENNERKMDYTFNRIVVRLGVRI